MTPASVARMVRVGELADVTTAGSTVLASPEIENLHNACGCDLDVRGLEVAMDDSFFVRRFERLGDLPGDAQRLVQ